ncbi:lipopolysaccharide biosynthesis protein [Pedobacter agri]|uniref:lipopolysaccharide biosynthesis protein n=1 Tax=Pedobacter agri TaxID=454586 RepID=UPI002788B0DB|nr:lipopolysaccharide biosynthesis protein [Pedobacter agri]MDQ1141120.1 uncharacterized protein involved in exopolysaccharide biosynthesis [Pedobacter agri]
MTNDSQKSNNNFNEEVSLKKIIETIRAWIKYIISKWIIISLFGLTGSLFAFYYAKNRVPVYTATTTFVLEDEKSGTGLGNLAGLASMAGVDINGNSSGIFQGDNIIELYKSRKMIVQALLSEVKIHGKTQLMIDGYIEFNKLKEKWLTKPDLSELTFKVDRLEDGNKILLPNRTRDSVLNGIVQDISVNYLFVTKLDKKLSIIKVDVKAKDEVFAKMFNDAIVRNVNEFFLNTKTKRAKQNVFILEQKTDSVRAVMNGAIYSAVAVSDATPNLNPTRQVQRVVPTQRAQFSAETNKAILSSLVQNLEMSKLTLMKETPLLEVIDQPILPLSVERVSKLKAILVGGFIMIFIIVLVLTIRRYIQSLLRE